MYALNALKFHFSFEVSITLNSNSDCNWTVLKLTITKTPEVGAGCT